MYVSHCTFAGTDVGLRFKSARGRGGVVENIYVNDINMKDILGDAVYFDTYYQAKDPVPSAGDKTELPTIEMKPVDEGTPLFQHFFFHNIVCLGADNAIYIRGLPEMNVKDVNIDNAVFKTKHGIHCEEATRVSLKNITVLPEDTDPVVAIGNSNQVTIDNLHYKDSADLFITVCGERTKDIRILNTDVTRAKKQSVICENVLGNPLTIIK
jgi:DNA sulfur modification protein DndE